MKLPNWVQKYSSCSNKMKYLKLYLGKTVKPSALSSIIHFKLQKSKQSFYRIPQGKAFTKSVKICKIHEGFSSTDFLYFKYVFIVSEPNWTQKLDFIPFLLVNKTFRASMIWGRNWKCFYMFKWLFINHFMICTNIPLSTFKDNWPGF